MSDPDNVTQRARRQVAGRSGEVMRKEHQPSSEGGFVGISENKIRDIIRQEVAAAVEKSIQNMVMGMLNNIEQIINSLKDMVMECCKENKEISAKVSQIDNKLEATQEGKNSVGERRQINLNSSSQPKPEVFEKELPTFANVTQVKSRLQSYSHSRGQKDTERIITSNQRPANTDDIQIEGTHGSKQKEWHTVTYKKTHRKTVVLKGENSKIGSLQAIEKKKYLHVWSLHLDTSNEGILSHVKEICGDGDNISVEKIAPKTKRDYSSFKIGVPESQYEKIARADVWPLNTRFSDWIWFRSPRPTAK